MRANAQNCVAAASIDAPRHALAALCERFQRWQERGCKVQRSECIAKLSVKEASCSTLLFLFYICFCSLPFFVCTFISFFFLFFFCRLYPLYSFFVHSTESAKQQDKTFHKRTLKFTCASHKLCAFHKPKCFFN